MTPLGVYEMAPTGLSLEAEVLIEDLAKEGM